jgi:rod shape determining protein RodA
MSIGLMPITGLPLPFISAGKTFLVTLLAALGIVQSISLHREEKI